MSEQPIEVYEPEEGLPAVLSRGRTVEAWCKALRERHGVRIAARTMKKRARDRGQFFMCGKQMLLLPEHVDALFAEKSGIL